MLFHFSARISKSNSSHEFSLQPGKYQPTHRPNCSALDAFWLSLKNLSDQKAFPSRIFVEAVVYEGKIADLARETHRCGKLIDPGKSSKKPRARSFFGRNSVRRLPCSFVLSMIDVMVLQSASCQLSFLHIILLHAAT